MDFAMQPDPTAARTAPPPMEAPVFDHASRPGEGYRVGFGKASLLPPDWAEKTYYMAGYGCNNPVTGVLDEPGAFALLVDDGTGRGNVLLVSCDCVGFLHRDVAALRSRLMASLPGLRAVHLFSTHNHAGIDTMGMWGPLPKTGKDPAYMAFLADQVEAAARAAAADQRPCDLYLGEAEAEGLQEDARLPVVYSRTMTRVRIVPQDGGREVWWLNFASHSESLQGCNSRISADFPQYLRRRILAETGAETFYCVGAIGGMITMAVEHKSDIYAAGGDFHESTIAIGRKLAEVAIGIRRETRLAPCLDLLRMELDVPLDNSVLAAAGLAGIMESDCYAGNGETGLALRTEMNYLTLGSLRILTLPGELFPELAYGGYLKEETSATGLGPEANPTPLTRFEGGRGVMFIGLADDEIGYIIPPNDFLLSETSPYFEKCRDRLGRRHYEETNSPGPRAAAAIAETWQRMLAIIQAGGTEQ